MGRSRLPTAPRREGGEDNRRINGGEGGEGHGYVGGRDADEGQQQIERGGGGEASQLLNRYQRTHSRIPLNSCSAELLR